MTGQMLGTYTTKVQTEDGRVYDLGKMEHPPKHEHLFSCPGCNVVDAWTELAEAEP